MGVPEIYRRHIRDLGHVRFCRSDGGRAEAGYMGEAGDCGVRAFAHAMDWPYQEAYDYLREIAGKTPRDGYAKKNMHRA